MPDDIPVKLAVPTRGLTGCDTKVVGGEDMGVFDFIKAAGHKLGIGGDGAPKPDELKKQVADLGFATDKLDIQVEGDTVKVSGEAASQEEKEKIVLALGNTEGIAKVEENITTPAGSKAVFYTVQSGDTLSKIAKAKYGDARKHNVIFKANKPMLTHPDKIYPGQILRIPPIGIGAGPHGPGGGPDE